MAKKNERQVRVVPVPRDKPDLDRLAKAIVALALKQLNEQKQLGADSEVSAPESSSADGAAA